MKLITLNIHSIVEKDYEKKLDKFVETICKLKPEIFVLQECNQTRDAKKVPIDKLFGCVGTDMPIKENNNAYIISKLLRNKGLEYNWYWNSAKKGYDILDEGLAVFSLKPIESFEYFYLSDVKDYNNWKTRISVGCTINYNGNKKSFYSVHFGWWNDKEENIKGQWQNLQKHFENRNDEHIYIMGDFNSPSHIKNEGYDFVCSTGWYDTYEIAKIKDDGITVPDVIDGWRDKFVEKNGMRIDYIFSNKPINIKSHNVIFNGKNEDIISDHFGIIVEE